MVSISEADLSFLLSCFIRYANTRKKIKPKINLAKIIAIFYYLCLLMSSATS